MPEKINEKNVIYVIYNMINKKKYIGQTVNMNIRWSDHMRQTNGCRSSKHFYKAMRKYGVKNFKLIIKKRCKTEEELDFWEQWYIDFYVMLDKKLNRETLYNIARDVKRPMRGLKHTEESKKKLSIANSGKNNHFYGKHLSEEHIEKIRQANLGRICSEESKQRISKANSGRKHSDQSRKNMSEAHKGKPNGRKGLPMTEKQRKHMEKMRACRKEISPKRGNFKYINHKEEWKILYFNQGYSIQEICVRYNVSDTAVQNVLKSFDVNMDNGKDLREKRRIEKLKLAGQKYTELSDDIVADYKITLSFLATAENFKTTHHTVARYVREEEKRTGNKIIPEKEVHYRRRKYTELLPIWIEMYNSGISSKKIGDQYNVTPGVVRGVLKKEGVIMRKPTDSSYYKQTKYVDFVDKWIELKSQGKTIKDIAMLYNVDWETVKNYLKNFQKA